MMTESISPLVEPLCARRCINLKYHARCRRREPDLPRQFRRKQMKPQGRWSGAIAMLLVLLMALALPRVTSAGGVSIVLDEPPGTIHANVAFTVGFLIRSAHED